MSVPVQQPGPLLAAILTRCAENPYIGDDLKPDDVTFQQQMSGDCIMFRRVCTRCHNSRKVPDWGNWNAEYGEPRPKPCPECAEWSR